MARFNFGSDSFGREARSGAPRANHRGGPLAGRADQYCPQREINGSRTNPENATQNRRCT